VTPLLLFGHTISVVVPLVAFLASSIYDFQDKILGTKRGPVFIKGLEVPPSSLRASSQEAPPRMDKVEYLFIRKK